MQQPRTLPHGATRLVTPRSQRLLLYSVDLGSTSQAFPFSRETFTVRSDAEHFIEEVRGEDPQLGATLRIDEHELDVASLN